VRRRRGVVGGRVQPGHQSGAQMAGHDHEGRNTAQALGNGNRVSRQRPATSNSNGDTGRGGGYTHLSSWRRGEAWCQVPGARCQVPDARCQMPDASERR
jgi:hypothetical protein